LDDQALRIICVFVSYRKVRKYGSEARYVARNQAFSGRSTGSETRETTTTGTRTGHVASHANGTENGVAETTETRISTVSKTVRNSETTDSTQR
jgi:hypothetical protein